MKVEKQHAKGTGLISTFNAKPLLRAWMPTLFLMMICCSAIAQNTEAARRAAAIAEKQALDEKLSRLTSTMEGLVNDQLNLLKQIQSQATEIRELRAEVARLKADQELQRKAAESAVTQAEFKSLVAQINQSESKRKKDQELILDSIEDIGKARITAAQAAQNNSANNSSNNSKSVKPDPQPSVASVGYEYEVQPGDNISSIVASYRESGVPVTVNMVLKANPSVVPERLQVGTKLFIPDPREE